jgi:hypothetical protein
VEGSRHRASRRADELDRLAGDVAHRQRRAAAGVAVGLGQHDAGQRQRLAEGLGGDRGVLAGHRVDHEQGLDRVDSGVQGLDLGHHRLVDAEAAGGIDDEHVGESLARVGDRGLWRCPSGFCEASDGKKVAPDLRRPASCSCSIAAGR